MDIQKPETESVQFRGLTKEQLEKMKEEIKNTSAMLVGWAQKQAHSILKSRELQRAPETLLLSWIHAKRGWVGGFVSGVQAGFQLGMKAQEKLTAQFLKESIALATSENGELTPTPPAPEGQESLPGL
jgi:hypothetical protein